MVKNLTLREAREVLELSRTDLQKLSGISMEVIQRIENCSSELNNRLETAILLADALGMDVTEIEWPNKLTNRGRPPLTGRKITLTVVTVAVASIDVCDKCYCAFTPAGTCFC